MKYDIDKLIGEMDFHSNELNSINDRVMLTNYEIEVLDKYKINYKSCTNLKEILFEIEEIFLDTPDTDCTDLDQVSQSIAERDYYYNTNK